MLGSFLNSLVLVFREGLEALLVVAAIAAYLTKAGGGQRLRSLYIGVGLAIAVTLLLAVALRWFDASHIPGGLEGALMLGAAGLMLYVSGWLVIHHHAGAWQNYLKLRAHEALSRKAGYGMAALGFFVVLREGIETILFLYALNKGAGGITVVAGAGTAGLALVGTYFALKTASVRIPLRTIFLVTSAFLFLMALKLIGEAFQEFQAQHLVSSTAIKGGDWLSTVGFGTTWEAIIVQFTIVACALATMVGVLRRGTSPTCVD